jgi:hypothetical protein
MSRLRSRLTYWLFGLAACTFFNPAGAVVLPWYNGVLANIGTDMPCNGSGSEVRVDGYAGQSLLPPNFTPAVGEVFYTHLVLGHPGNPCLGSVIGIELILPAGVNTAISAADPVFCFSRLPPNAQHNNFLLDNLATDPGYGCPQAFSQGLQGLAIYAPHGGAGGGSWGMVAGFFLELLVPLKASAPQNGSNSIYFRVNPDIGVLGYPSVPANVNSDVIFRSPMENQDLTLDICTVAPIAQGCWAHSGNTFSTVSANFIGHGLILVFVGAMRRRNRSPACARNRIARFRRIRQAVAPRALLIKKIP